MRAIAERLGKHANRFWTRNALSALPFSRSCFAVPTYTCIGFGRGDGYTNVLLAYLDVRNDKTDTNWLLLDYEVRRQFFLLLFFATNLSLISIERSL